LGGLFIPAHVDRRANGLLFNLGFVPVDIPVEAVEISVHLDPAKADQVYRALKGFPLLQSGDVHHLDDFLGSTWFRLHAVTIAEMRMAIRGENGRSLQIKPAL
ncbi:MAG TPA: hypothetical protein VFF68_14375, partial [Anaerolineaceae bacterium]|nr:hypothetical protein [Anaerolineaceae bacterium]